LFKAFRTFFLDIVKAFRTFLILLRNSWLFFVCIIKAFRTFFLDIVKAFRTFLVLLRNSWLFFVCIIKAFRTFPSFEADVTSSNYYLYFIPQERFPNLKSSVHLK
jgi:hypothetical protein